MLTKYDYPLEHSVNWAHTQELLTKPFWGTSTTNHILLSCGSSVITEFPGDCGCLIIKYALYLTPTVIQEILNFASKSGYSKIICTLSTEYKIDHIKQYLKDFGFKIQYTGKSNRSYSNNYDEIKAKTYLCYKVIQPTTIGYGN